MPDAPLLAFCLLALLPAGVMGFFPLIVVKMNTYALKSPKGTNAPALIGNSAPSWDKAKGAKAAC